MMGTRSSGIILHISSLPSACGIGDLGAEAYRFVDFLKKAGQRYWQILPTNPTGFGDSPYQALSAFAGNHYFIDPEALVRRGWLDRAQLDTSWGEDCTAVDFGLQYEKKTALLRRAYERFRLQPPEDFSAFCRAEASWLEDYCLFRALKEHFFGLPWQQWERGLKRRDPNTMDTYRNLLGEEMDFHRFLQYCFFRQWERLRRYANENGVEIIGDIPIYVPMDSADVWANPENFQLTSTLRPRAVAGCPPDAFSRDGQYWGNPLYDWERMEETGYDWWLRRICAAARLYDVIRIDHFRGLESYWAIPGRNKTARAGQWLPGPGMKLLKKIRERCPETEFIAEDLGFLTESVRQLVRDSGFPGMKVLEFAFDSGPWNEYLPHHYPEGCICYTGTHDNDTLQGWLDTRGGEELAFLRSYLSPAEDTDLRWAVLELGMQSRAVCFMAQMQDYLGLDGSARMNRPGISQGGNWCWRMTPGAAADELACRILSMTEAAGRAR